MKHKIKELFHVETGVRITEREVYEHQGKIPCVTSQTLNEGIAWYADEKWLNTFKKNGNSLIINKPCITWSKDGACAGTIFYRNYEFYPNDHCGVLVPKDTNVINLLWFVYTQKSTIEEYVTNKDGQGMLYNEQMSEIVIDVPSLEIQNKIVEEYNSITRYRNNINSIYKKIEKLYNQPLNISGDYYLVKEICQLETGSTIGEELIYKNYDAKGIPVFSSKTDGPIGFVNKEFYKNSNKKGYTGDLIWATRGNAGNIKIIDEDFLFTSNCGRIKINNIQLVIPNYLKIILNMIIKDKIIGKANLGQLTVEQLGNVGLHIPPIQKQNEIVKEFQIIDDIKNKINNLNKIIN